MSEGKTLGAKQVATRIGTDAKTFRKFLRQIGYGVGQGRRYDFPEADLPHLAKTFAAWLADSKAPKTAKTSTGAHVTPKPAVPKMKLKGQGATIAIVADDNDEEDDLELELDDEPSDEEIFELDDEEDDLEIDDDEEDD